MPWSFWHAFSKSLVAVAISSITWHNVSWAIDWAMRFSAACFISDVTIVAGCVNWAAVAPVGDRQCAALLPVVGLPRRLFPLQAAVSASLFSLDRAIPRLFSIFYFNSRRDQKRARQIHTLERVATLFLGLRNDAQNVQLLQKFTRNNETIKAKKDDTNIHVLNWGGPPLEVQKSITFPTPKTASNKSNNLICRPDSARKRKMRKML